MTATGFFFFFCVCVCVFVICDGLVSFISFFSVIQITENKVKMLANWLIIVMPGVVFTLLEIK